MPDLVEAGGPVEAGVRGTLVHFQVAVPALVAWHAVAGVVAHAVPAQRPVAARLGAALVHVPLAQPARVASAAQARGPLLAALARAPVLTRVAVTLTASSFTGRAIGASRALAGEAEVPSRAQAGRVLETRVGGARVGGFVAEFLHTVH